MKKKGRAISYRKATNKDSSYLLKLYESTREDVRQMAYNMSYDEQTEFIKMQFEFQDIHYKKYYPDADFLIVRLRKKDIGRLYIEEWPTQFRIIDIIIDPDYRSKGIGEIIMSEIIERGEAKNKSTSIHVDKNNRAISFYTRLGFKIIGGTDVYHLMSRECHKEQNKSIELKSI